MTRFLDASLKEGKRLVYLMGMTTDSFCTSSTLQHSLESLLLLQLREWGFRRIIYYSASKKLHWLDIETARLCASKQRIDVSSQVETNCRTIRPGPLGSGLLRKQPSSTTATPMQSAAMSVRWHLGAMTDAEVVRTAKIWLLDREIPTALIIRDAADLLTHFDRDAQRLMNEMFLDIQRAGNSGLCVMVFPQHHSTEMLTRNKDTWANLIAPMLTRSQDGALSSSVLIIGPPDEREIANSLVAERLNRQEPTDNKAILDKAAYMARQARFAYAKHDAQAGQVGGLHWLSLQNFEEKAMQNTTGMQRLEAMTGMKPIVETLRGMILLAKEERDRSKPQTSTPESRVDVGRLGVRKAKPEGNTNLHLALVGNPGTGKTHVARLIAEIYREEGLLETGHLVEVTRKDLVAGYVGQTAINTGAAIERAMGGVLFIDEAYQLSEGGDQDFGKEAIETVMKAMSDHNGHFAVIIAGYPDRICDFIEGPAANPGLARRFPKQNRLNFADYNPEQLQSIFLEYVSRSGLSLEEELRNLLPSFFSSLYLARDPERFGNAGEIINLINAMNQARVLREDMNGLKTLSLKDIPENLRLHLPGQCSPGQMQSIYVDYVSKQGLTTNEELLSVLPSFFASWVHDPNCLGNAGEVINLVNAMNQARELRAKSVGPKALLLEDLPTNLRRHLSAQADSGSSDALDQLNALVGLAPVKEQIRRLSARLRIDQLRDPSSRPDPGHYLFLGAPGTGKTTVAKILGNVLRDQGLLARGHVVEAGREKLVAGYQGQTALKTEEKLKEALDGILFIDEAYQLVTDSHDSFGREALETLVAFMENHRNRLTIIAAGYPEPMLRFINANPGLPSRFKYRIDFPSYTAEEMMDILEGEMKKTNVYLTPVARDKVATVLISWEARPHPGFANGRDVRNLLDNMLENQAMRLSNVLHPDSEAMSRIEADDVPDLPYPYLVIN